MKNNKEINWSFNWAVGGYNNVSAATYEEALENAKNKGEGWNSVGVRNLQPDADFAITRANDRSYAGMFD